MLRATGVALCGVLCYSLLKTYKPEYASLCEIGTAAVLFIMIAEELVEVKGFFSEMLAASGIASDFMRILLKSLGTAVVTQFAADTAKDVGESALASKIEFTGRVVIVYCSLPLLKAIAQLISGLTENM